MRLKEWIKKENKDSSNKIFITGIFIILNIVAIVIVINVVRVLLELYMNLTDENIQQSLYEIAKTIMTTLGRFTAIFFSHIALLTISILKELRKQPKEAKETESQLI